MRSAKLFAGLAIILAISAFICPWIVDPHFDIYLHDGYFVIANSHVLLLVAVICAILSGAYFAIAHWAPRPPNQPGGLISFALIALSVSSWLGLGLIIRKDKPVHQWQMIALVVPFLSFLFGLALSGAVLVWALAWNSLVAVQARFSRGR